MHYIKLKAAATNQQTSDIDFDRFGQELIFRSFICLQGKYKEASVL